MPIAPSYSSYPNGHKISEDPRGHCLGAQQTPLHPLNVHRISRAAWDVREPYHPDGVPYPTPYTNRHASLTARGTMPTAPDKIPPNSPNNHQTHPNIPKTPSEQLGDIPGQNRIITRNTGGHKHNRKNRARDREPGTHDTTRNTAGTPPVTQHRGNPAHETRER